MAKDTASATPHTTINAVALMKGHLGAVLAETPFKLPRLCLCAAAILLAIGTIAAQATLMNHNYEIEGEYYSSYYMDYTTFYTTINGKLVAKAPALPLATAAVALPLAAILFASLFFKPTSASLWAAIAHVVLVPVIVCLWLASMAVSAKTANVLKGAKEADVWVGSNAAALALECVSLIVWNAILLLSIIALVRVVKAWRDSRQGGMSATGGAAQAPNGADAA